MNLRIWKLVPVAPTKSSGSSPSSVSRFPIKSTSFSPDLYQDTYACRNLNLLRSSSSNINNCLKNTISPAHMVSSSMSFSSVLLVAVELPDVLLPSSGFTSSSVRQSTSRSPSDRSWMTKSCHTSKSCWSKASQTKNRALLSGWEPYLQRFTCNQLSASLSTIKY